MADLVLGLAKTTVEGTVTMARLAMEEEDKLKKSVQRDLLVISDEFEMMHAFLSDCKGRVTDNVTRTMVRQVRNTALDVEDCIETIVHLDNKPHWWRRMMLPWCMPAAAPSKDLDAVVASVEQLKARVDAMAQRRLRYNYRVDDCCHKAAEHQHAAIPTGAATGAAKQSGQVDLITLINGKGGADEGQARQGNNNDDRKAEEKDENAGDNNDGEKEEGKDKIEEAVGNETEEAGNEGKGKQEVDPELKVISVLGTGSDLDMMFIKKAYDYSTTCDNFKCRAWVKLVHPLNPIELIRSLLAQFQKNSCQEQGNTVNVLEAIVAPESVLIEMFMTQISQKYLVVLEDVSTMVDWEAVKSYLPDNKDGSCIVVHTRYHGIALSCVGHQYPVSEVEMLLADHSVRVVFKKVAKKSIFWTWDLEDEETRYQSEQTRDILLNKCGGFPKVICAVAESWRLFRKIKVKDNLVPGLLEASRQLATVNLEDMFSWLLAYFGSCPDSLKPCIFYLTIFPVNHTIRRRRLVRRWIVEGYTWDNKQITAEETANEFFSRLVKLSMIQSPQGPRYLPSSKRMPLCQVNGFLREYVISKSMEENFVFELEGNCKNLQRDLGTNNHYIKGVDMACIVQHLAIDKSWDRDRNVFESIDFSRLRSLTVFGRWESFLISDKMGRLRVLDLEDVSSGLTDDDVETMVKLLQRLKFLSLRGCAEITHLPSSLGDLKQLHTLDIRETSVRNLPKSIIKLERLQYIRAGRPVILDDNSTAGTCGSLPVAAAANPSTSGTPMRRPRATVGSCMSKFSIHHHLYDGPHYGVNVPRGIGKLSGSLHTLGVVNISAAGGEDILDELKNLTLLHKLGVYGINRKISEKLFSAISRLAHLESLSLQFQPNQDHEAAIRLSPLEKLRSLKLYGLADRLPTWIMLMCSRSQLPRLEKLDLQMRKLPQQQLDSIITLPHLWILRLRLAEFEDEEIRFGWSIPRSSSNGGWYFKFLEISCNSRLQAVRFASSVDVEILKIQCSTVSRSLKFFGLRAMKRLKEVWLSGSYDNAFKDHLKEEVENSSNPYIKPIVLPE